MSNKVIIQHGITGNYYVKCISKEPLINICDKINKSHNSIVFHNKVGLYVIRVKNKKQKELLKQIKNNLT